MRLILVLQRFCKCFMMKHVTPNKLATGNGKNEMKDFTIAESLFSWTTLCFPSTSYSNTMTSQNQASVVRLKPLESSPENLSGMECARTWAGISAIVTLANEARPLRNI
jgi:hypothetical protein